MPHDLSVDQVSRVLAKHAPVYRKLPPVYQTAMFKGLRDLWMPGLRRMLDVGGGTGVVAEAMKELFEIDYVASVDVEDRYKKTLSIETKLFDGVFLPFQDDSFDCVVLNNVIHHVPRSSRDTLLRECARVAGTGPLFVKDHVAASPLDHVRLAALDVAGNLPSGGMVKASYLSLEEWRALAAASGLRIDRSCRGDYRSGLFGSLFPNRLEIAMRWFAIR